MYRSAAVMRREVVMNFGGLQEELEQERGKNDLDTVLMYEVLKTIINKRINPFEKSMES